MARGRLDSPNLDDRKWQDIVDQAKALIPTYAPEWTDHNPSDLGIALIELFAWLVEGMTYRLNRVPEKNFIEFLNLLGITRDPATPASTFLTYSSASGTAPLPVLKGSQAATKQTETEAAIVFETDRDLTVLPINLTTALYDFGDGAVEKYQNVTNKLIGSPLSGMNIPLQTTYPGDWGAIVLGFDAASTEPIALSFRFSKPAPKNDFYIYGAYSIGSTGGFSFFPILEPPPSSDYPVVDDGTKGFQQNGILSITLPGTLSNPWKSQNPQSWLFTSPDSNADTVNKSLFWLAIVVYNLSAQPIELGLQHILFNSVPATNALTIPQSELLGTSNGKPFQFFDLQNAPLFKRPNAEDPYDHLLIQVREPLVGGGFGPWTDWTHLDDFPAGSGLYFRLNPVTGTINFGNYDPVTSSDGHGRIPPLDSEIRAVTYRYVAGGAKGNVAPDTIRTPLSGLVSVTNPGAATGGSDEEAIEDTKRRGPEALRNRYRAVTVEDYEYLAKESTTDVKKVRCLPPRLATTYDPPGVPVGTPWTFGGLDRSVSNVHVIVLPDASLSNPTPRPTEELIKEVSDYLEARRIVTSLLNVTGPRYLPIKVHLEVNVWQKAIDEGLVEDPTTSDKYKNDLKAKIRRFLHPILGGPEQTGWEVGQDITVASLFEFIQPDTDVGFISSLEIEALPPLYEPNNRPPGFPVNVRGVWVQVADYEIICSAPSEPPTDDHDIQVKKI